MGISEANLDLSGKDSHLVVIGMHDKIVFNSDVPLNKRFTQ